MSSEVVNTPGGLRDGNISLGGPHPGLETFCQDYSLRYFNKESILREELAGGDIELYQENQNIFLAIGKIYLLKCALAQKSEEKQSCPDTSSSNEPNSLRKENNITPVKKNNLNRDSASPLNRHSLLLRRLRQHDLSLADSDNDSAVNVTMTSQENRSPGGSQDEEQNLSQQDSEDLLSTQENDQGIIKKGLLQADVGSLFRLMSILPKPMDSFCKQVMDKDNFAWKISWNDVILVFLNWGATSKSLQLDSTFDFSEKQLLPPHFPSPFSDATTSKGVFPDPSNVRLVLSAVIERLPAEGEATASASMRSAIVRMLVLAALDMQHQHRQNLRLYCVLISTLLDSFHAWDKENAAGLVNDLRLECLDLQNAAFVCCSVFSMLNPRKNLVGLLACHNVLHHRFGLPYEPSFPFLVGELALPLDLLERFTLKDIYVMTQLLHSLLIRHTSCVPPCAQEAVDKLLRWTVEVRSTLTQVPYKFNLLSGFVRERFSRLSSECTAIVRRVYNNSISRSYNINSFVEDSPSK